MTAPLLFLSHAGADTAAAKRLKDRIEATPAAKEAGLRVWFDKDDLEAGPGWQTQLERALKDESTAFAVYIGGRGVLNWVDMEVRVALTRAVSDPDYPFVPIFGPDGAGVDALPCCRSGQTGFLATEHRHMCRDASCPGYAAHHCGQDSRAHAARVDLACPKVQLLRRMRRCFVRVRPESPEK